MLLLLALPVVALQMLHAWSLGRVWPSHRRLIVRGLLVFNLLLLLFPLAVFTGWVPIPIQLGLRSLGHGVVHFQVFTGFHLLFALSDAGIQKLRNRQRSPSAGRTLLYCAIALGLTGTFAHLGPRTTDSPRVVHVDMVCPDLPPGLEGLRIAHLSDLHAGPHADLKRLQHWRALAEAEHPDLLALTGDYVDSRPEEMMVVCEAFQDFNAPLGRFAVLGNHDHLKDSRPIATALRGIGIEVVDNETRSLQHQGASFTLFGLQDPQAAASPRTFGPGPTLPDLTKAALWRLALVHRPDQWPMALQGGASLTLCGHTHGGQINPLDGLSPAKFLWSHIAGPYDSHGRWLHVSPGLGVVGIPIRIQAPGEITILTLRQKKTLATQSS